MKYCRTIDEVIKEIDNFELHGISKKALLITTSYLYRTIITDPNSINNKINVYPVHKNIRMFLDDDCYITINVYSDNLIKLILYAKDQVSEYLISFRNTVEDKELNNIILTEISSLISHYSVLANKDMKFVTAALNREK